MNTNVTPTHELIILLITGFDIIDSSNVYTPKSNIQPIPLNPTN